MTTPLSSPVLGAAALLSSPALYDSFVTGAMPIESGVTRFLVAAAVVWFGLSLVSALLQATSPESRGESEEQTYALTAADRSLAPRPGSAEVRDPSTDA